MELIPESLRRVHEDGEIVFFCGAGVSMPAGLPSFKGLTRDILTDMLPGRADSGGRRVKKKGGQKIGPRNTSKPKKKPKQVRLPFADRSEHRPERAAASATAHPCSPQWED